MSWGKGENGGDIYKGLWHNDRRVKGWLKMSDGTEYEGEWEDDVMHGHGRLTFRPDKKGEKGVVYEGRFRNGIQANEGTLSYPNSDFY